ncbi:ABC transporter permease [Sorangium cellulosum]|uniref:ABC transporter permease n=1 Tax=Sorangium cellulosum TaxID=56 RepID=A0A2L0F5A3_SORCE|nr:ABC-2 family transporter protein [Sorangium cellulosum]AUX46733.1 ABC transporter permease [Sorangium cellulosum]
MSSLSRAARAFPTLLRVGVAAAMAYRAEMLIWMLTTTMPLVSLALWSAVAASAPVGRFGADDFTEYFLAILIVRQLTGSWLVWEMNMDIKSGALSQRLLKPIHPLVSYAADNLAALPLRALLCLPITVVALVVTSGAREPPAALDLGIWALALMGAWLLNFFTMALIGSLAFVIESSTAVFDIYLAAFMIFAGYLVPLELFPSWLGDIARVLPFRYSLAFPVELITGMLDPGRALVELGVQWAFAAGTAAAALVAWRAGVRRFAAFGG